MGGDHAAVHWYVRFLEERVDELRKQLSFAAATSRGPVVAASAPEPDAASGGLAGSALRAGLKLEEEHASELAREWAAASG